jgi:DNA polymerase III subunit epsilon
MIKCKFMRKHKVWNGVPDKVLILDIEASGLHKDSFPIEIAYGDPKDSWVTSSLIRPHPTWNNGLWDQEAITLTGILPELLQCAPLATQVTKNVAKDLSQADLILSDAPAWDARWLNRLLDLNPTPVNIKIEDFRATINKFNPLRKYLSTYKCLNIYDKSEHRAGGDVIRLLRVYRRALPLPLWEEQYCPIKHGGFASTKRPKFIPGIPE